MRAAILANGRMGSRHPRPGIRSADIVICADGGLRAARRLGIRPDVAIGDFDSASGALVRWAQVTGAEIVRHARDKDKTDAELALDYALARGARDIDFYGALGGRLDHLLANVTLLANAAARRARLRIVDGPIEAFLARSRTPLDVQVGERVSLIPLSATARGITTRGLRYPLRRGTLRQGSSRGISNEVVSLPASVTVRDGRLLIVVIHKRRQRAIGSRQ